MGFAATARRSGDERGIDLVGDEVRPDRQQCSNKLMRRADWVEAVALAAARRRHAPRRGSAGNGSAAGNRGADLGWIPPDTERMYPWRAGRAGFAVAVPRSGW